MSYKPKHPFYNNPKWLKKRDLILKRDDYLCRQCKRYGKTTPANTVHHIFPYVDYPDYKLRSDNLLSLCNECHNQLHDRANDTMTDKGLYWQNKVRDRLGINETHNIDTFRVVVVWGSPGSGKTTYVRNHMGNEDMVVDLDYIKQAITMKEKTADIGSLLGAALNLRSYIYDLIEQREVIECKTVWVVAGLPKRADREHVKRKLRPNDMVFIDKPMEECISNAMGDNDRIDKGKQAHIIGLWFEQYEA